MQHGSLHERLHEQRRHGDRLKARIDVYSGDEAANPGIEPAPAGDGSDTIPGSFVPLVFEPGRARRTGLRPGGR